MISKRRLLTGLVAAASAAALSRSATARSPAISSGELRGSIDASAHGVTPGGGETTRRNLQRLLTEAAGRNMPVYLPPGDYPMSGIDLSDGTRLIGICGSNAPDPFRLRRLVASRKRPSHRTIRPDHRWRGTCDCRRRASACAVSQRGGPRHRKLRRGKWGQDGAASGGMWRQSYAQPDDARCRIRALCGQ